MADWLSSAERDPIPGAGGAPFDHETNPTWKLLLHTTEGTSYAGARASYSRNGFAPNVTVGPHPSKAKTVKAWQHIPLDQRSTTLADSSGGIRTNRDYVIQVEIVGFADLKQAARYARWLGVDAWPDWYKQGVAKILNDILDAKPIPRRCTVRWVTYPSSYGLGASQRLSTSEFDAYRGILGHQHAPENSHGDPGDLSEFVRNYLLNEEDDMANVWKEKLTPSKGQREVGGYPEGKSYDAEDFLMGVDAKMRRLEKLEEARYEALLSNVQQNDAMLRDVMTALTGLTAQVADLAAKHEEGKCDEDQAN